MCYVSESLGIDDDWLNSTNKKEDCFIEFSGHKRQVGVWNKDSGLICAIRIPKISEVSSKNRAVQ